MSRKDISEVSDTFIQNHAQKIFFISKIKSLKKLKNQTHKYLA